MTGDALVGQVGRRARHVEFFRERGVVVAKAVENIFGLRECCRKRSLVQWPVGVVTIDCEKCGRLDSFWESQRSGVASVGFDLLAT